MHSPADAAEEEEEEKQLLQAQAGAWGLVGALSPRSTFNCNVVATTGLRAPVVSASAHAAATM